MKSGVKKIAVYYDNGKRAEFKMVPGATEVGISNEWEFRVPRGVAPQLKGSFLKVFGMLRPPLRVPPKKRS